MTAISYLGITNGTTTAGPFNVTVPSSGGANKRMTFFIYNAESSSSGLQLTDVRYDSAGANTALTLVGRWEYSDGGTANEVVEIWRLPEASTQSGSKSFSWTKNGTTVGAARQSVVTFDGIDQTTPTNGTNNGDIVATTSGSCSVEANTDGGALATITVALSSTSHTWGGSFTEIQDGAMATNAARSVAYRIASGTLTPSVTLSGSDSGKLVAVALNADGFTTSIDLTSVNGGSAVTEGQTSVALVGTGMDESGAGARLRIVSDPTTYQAMSSYSASNSTNATATVPTLTSLPFSQNAAGVGLTTWNIEAIGTSTGGNDGTAVSVELRPASGWDVVEIATPDLSESSLLSALGWTGVATDLIQWESSVVVGSITVAITVNDDGTYQYEATYTVGGAAAPLPSFEWDYKAYDSASKLWTSAATVTVGLGIESSASFSNELVSSVKQQGAPADRMRTGVRSGPRSGIRPATRGPLGTR